MKCAPLRADSPNSTPLLATMPTGWPCTCAKPGDERRAVLRLELLEAAAVDEPRDDLAHVVRRARVDRHDAEQLGRVVRGRLHRLRAPTGGAGRGPSVATIRRTIRSACASSSARWSVTPEVREWSSPPPRSSAVTTSPVAAFTSGGPPRKIVPWSRDDDGLVGHRRHVRAAGGAAAEDGGDLRDALRAHGRLVEEDPAEVVAVGEDLVLARQEGAAGVDEVDARQPVLQGHLLRAQVLLHRHRVVGAALDGGVVGDDDALAARTPGRRR